MAPNPKRAVPDARKDLAQTLRRIYALDLTTTSGGNLSLRDEDGCLWITPAGIDKGELRPDQVVRVDGVVGVEDAEGHDDDTQSPAPSSELPFHQSIYAARSELRAIIHAHPVSLVAFSVAQQVPDTRVSAHCHGLCGKVGFARYALPGSRELGERIAETFATGFDCVVLENHGVVVAGTTLRQAFERLEALDLCARTILRARIMGRERPLPDNDLTLPLPPSTTIAVSSSAVLTDQESELRQTLCTIARRAHDKRLMTSTLGTLSARLLENAFLMTPLSVPMDRLAPSDLLRLDVEGIGGMAGIAPGSPGEHDPRKALHAALYRAHPEVGAVAHGCADNTGGFATTGIPLPARTIPESYILVREPVSVSFRMTIRDPESVAAVLCPDNPVALIENDGAIVLGASVLDAFDRLEVLEATAAAVISSAPLGRLSPMNDEQLAKLREAFFPKGGFHGAPHGGS